MNKNEIHIKKESPADDFNEKFFNNKFLKTADESVS
jgi:hypothetical protein